MEQEQSASEHMKFIFDLCDADNDGVITVEDFRRIGLEHLAKSQVSTVGRVHGGGSR